METPHQRLDHYEGLTSGDSVRYDVLKRDRVCQLCGNGPSDDALEVDHIEPLTRTKRALRLRSCPHCGGHASHVVRAPEVLACVLCPTCRRAPTPHSPVHPDDYFTT